MPDLQGSCGGDRLAAICSSCMQPYFLLGLHLPNMVPHGTFWIQSQKGFACSRARILFSHCHRQFGGVAAYWRLVYKDKADINESYSCKNNREKLFEAGKGCVKASASDIKDRIYFYIIFVAGSVIALTLNPNSCSWKTTCTSNWFFASVLTGHVLHIHGAWLDIELMKNQWSSLLLGKSGSKRSLLTNVQECPVCSIPNTLYTVCKTLPASATERLNALQDQLMLLKSQQVVFSFAPIPCSRLPYIAFRHSVKYLDVRTMITAIQWQAHGAI